MSAGVKLLGVFPQHFLNQPDSISCIRDQPLRFRLLNNQRARESVHHLKSGRPVHVRVIPEGAGRMKRRHANAILKVCLWRDSQERIVRRRLGRDMQSVGVQVGCVKAMGPVEMLPATGLALRGEVVDQSDSQLFTGMQFQGGTGHGAVVTARALDSHSVWSANRNVGFDHAQGRIEYATLR